MNMMRRDLPAQATLRAPAARPGQPAPAATPSSTHRPVSPRPGTPAALSAAAAAAAVTARAPNTRPSAKGDDLFQVIRQLSDLLVKENTALKKHRHEDVKALTEPKEQLARLYQSHMNAVHRDPGLVQSLDIAKRTALTQSAVRLGDLMQENASLLKANIESINMFFKAVNDAVKTRQEEKAAAYSRRGALNGYAVTKRSLAVSYNQTM